MSLGKETETGVGESGQAPTDFGCCARGLELYPLGLGEPRPFSEDSCDMLWQGSWGHHEG